MARLANSGRGKPAYAAATISASDHAGDVLETRDELHWRTNDYHALDGIHKHARKGGMVVRPDNLDTGRLVSHCSGRGFTSMERRGGGRAQILPAQAAAMTRTARCVICEMVVVRLGLDARAPEAVWGSFFEKLAAAL